MAPTNIPEREVKHMLYEHIFDTAVKIYLNRVSPIIYIYIIFLLWRIQP